MDETDRRSIRMNLLLLARQMDFDVVSTALAARLIYEPHHIQKFQSQPSKLLQNQALLMDLETRGPSAFTALVNALIEANQHHLAEALGSSPFSAAAATLPQTSTMQAHRVHPLGQLTMKQATTDPWPDPGSSGDFSSVQMDTLACYPDSMVDGDDVYRMKSKPRGIALIINNKRFSTKPTRTGTDVDCYNLQNVFKQFDFSVVVYTDQKGGEIRTHIEKFSRHNHASFDCFIFAALSHGDRGTIYGTDGEAIKTDEIIASFGSDQCPTLTGKPKLFFFQACRGEKFDKGVDQADGTPVAPDQDFVIKEDVDRLTEDLGSIELESTDSAPAKVPTQSDMLLAYATLPGYVSWRNAERGSWFIQALTEVFLEHAKQEDLLSMMTMVNQKVARAFESTKDRKKQMPAPVSMLTKKLYFLPGHPNPPTRH